MANELIGYGEELSSQLLDRRAAIQQALGEYRNLLRAESACQGSDSTAAKARIQLQLVRAVREYVRLCRAFEGAQSPAE